MPKSGRPENSAGQIPMFSELTAPEVDAKREPDGSLVRVRKPTQTTPRDREEIRRHITVTSAATVESRWDLKD